MSLTKKWYTVADAASKYGVSTDQLLQWVDCGLVRTEEDKGETTLLNSDDIEQELGLIPSV
ncbi:MAG: MerR family transcriptional regulator [Desulfuromonadales bacterium]